MGKALLKQGRDAEAIRKFRRRCASIRTIFRSSPYVAHVLAADEKPEVRDGQTALGYARPGPMS